MRKFTYFLLLIFFLLVGQSFRVKAEVFVVTKVKYPEKPHRTYYLRSVTKPIHKLSMVQKDIKGLYLEMNDQIEVVLSFEKPGDTEIFVYLRVETMGEKRTPAGDQRTVYGCTFINGASFGGSGKFDGGFFNKTLKLGDRFYLSLRKVSEEDS